MIVSVDLPKTDEAWLLAEAVRLGVEPAELIRKIVHQQAAPTLPPAVDAPRERIRAMDSLAMKNKKAPALPDSAFDREMLYEEPA